MKAIYTLVGTSHRGTREHVAAMKPGSPLLLRREPNNQHDVNAVQVWDGETHVGYVKAIESGDLARRMDAETGGRDWPAILARAGHQPQIEVEEAGDDDGRPF